MIKRFLEKEKFQVETFPGAASFFNRLKETQFPIVFIDLKLPDMDGLEVLKRLKHINPDSEAIIVTGYASIDTAVEATKIGAFHYLTKPLKRHDICLIAKRARDQVRLREENKKLRLANSGGALIEGFVGAGPAMQEIFALIKKVALVNCNVLLQAETGTGKQMVAKAIHKLSPRRGKPFVYFNCASFTEELISSELFGYEKGAFTGATSTKKGLFETANGGTVFLDEIGEMPMSMQVKLLHVLQERQILRVGGTKPIDLDVRIIAATNKDLKSAIQAGTFREDLFYRLNVVNIQLPRLADRKEDIPLLVTHFINKYSRRFKKNVRNISQDALNILLKYDFPGNVRELENIIQRAVALAEGSQIKREHLPGDLLGKEVEELLDDDGLLLPLEEVEKLHIIRVLRKTGFNKKLASKILNIPRTTLWRRMKKFGIKE
ncbi:sigma-54-dependent transcriptional regulator [Dissulfuribacter thermophilus]|nr:sigma-54 dependent transcriptional regulator [Dissulfuribacter thermophilus]